MTEKATDQKIADLRDRVLMRMIEEAQAEAAKEAAKAAKLQEILGRRNAKIEALTREIEVTRAELAGVRLGRDYVLSLHAAGDTPALMDPPAVGPDPYRNLWVELASMDDPTFWDPNQWPDHIKPLVAHIVRFDPPAPTQTRPPFNFGPGREYGPRREDDRIW